MLNGFANFCFFLVEILKKHVFSQIFMHFSNVHFARKNLHSFACNYFTYDRIQLKFLQKSEIQLQ